MHWRKIPWTFLAALLLATVVGAALGLVVYLAGNSDYRAQAGFAGLLYWLGLGGALGAATGLASALGGTIGLLVRDRTFSRGRAVRVRAGSTGAALGAAALWSGFGVVDAATTPTGATWAWAWVVVGLIAAILALTLAWVLLSRAERRAVTALTAPRSPRARPLA